MNILDKITFLFGISEHEVSRVWFSWILKFFLHTLTVLGFTIILAMFVGEYGLIKIPILFVTEALFAIAGTFALSSFLKQFPKKKALLIGVLLCFFLAILSFFLRETHPFIFFGTLIIGYSVVITQLNILFSLFTEDLFSPLESERTFPIIESAEPVGGIFAGLITGFGVSFFHIAPEYFVLIWGAISLMIVPILLYFSSRLNRIPKPHSQREHVKRLGITEEFKESWNNISNNPFLRNLFWGVIIQWFSFSIIEFLYSSSVALEFASDVAHGAVNGSHGDDKVAAELAHGLGMLHIVIYAILLVFQVFLASKIQKRLGVVQTILSHPLVIFISATIMTLSFNFNTVVATKGAFEVFGGPARNAYHSSFYIFRPHMRARAKEFLEGIARPGGMLIGTTLVIVLQIIFHYFNIGPDLAFLFFSFLVVAAMGIRLLFAMKTRDQYTMLARKNLETRGPAPEKIDAIEILAQRGHKNPAISLIKVLQMKSEKPEIKVKVLKTLAQITDPDAIPEILNCFNDEHIRVQIEAVQALASYKFLGQHFLSQSFARHRVIDSLQNLFLTSKSKKVKAAVIQVFKNIQHPEIVPFLLNTLDTQDSETLKGAIQVCGMFHDLSAAHYIEKFLTHKDSQVKAEVIIAMWQFISYRLKLTMTLAQMFESKDDKEVMSAIYVVGEIKSVLEMPRLFKILKESNDIHIKKNIYISLAKLEHSAAIHSIVEMIIHPDKNISSSTRKLIFAPSVEKNLQKIIKQKLEAKMAHRIHSLLKDEKSEILENMRSSTLEILYQSYEVLGEEKEMMQILEVLEERRSRKKREAESENNISRKKTSESSKISLEDLL